MTDPFIPSLPDRKKPVVIRPRLSQWAWRPWYAKLWWASIAIYWTLGAGAFLFPPLAYFFTSSTAGFFDIVFYPVFALAFLSIGWIRAWVEALNYMADNPEVEDTLGWEWSMVPCDFQREMMVFCDDPSEATSPSYIANETLRRVFDR